MFVLSATSMQAVRRRVRSQPLAVIGVILLAAFVVCGLTAPLIAPYNPAAIDLVHRLQGPTAPTLQEPTNLAATRSRA